MPPLPDDPARIVLGNAASKLGWHHGPILFAINSIPRSGRPACSGCQQCMGNTCPTGAKTAPTTPSESAGRDTTAVPPKTLPLDGNVEMLGFRPWPFATVPQPVPEPTSTPSRSFGRLTTSSSSVQDRAEQLLRAFCTRQEQRYFSWSDRGNTSTLALAVTIFTENGTLFPAGGTRIGQSSRGGRSRRA